ncbi:complex III assembly factor LYRM7 [Condylostylus longicornis]|uniref:complex III assembly factor LYRM7 n=1 Tax=Condylostylus longicornis TaxID=2530218 RepID=UPI00244E3007|nr:complex III assembly factor LYRM7 [Condylostylus longicornis]
MENFLRRQVLAQFKKLHQTRKLIFNGDERALIESRKLINEGFKKNKYLKEKLEIQKEIQFAIDVRKELENNVIQAVETKPGVYEANVRDNILMENYMFNPDAVLTKPAKGKKCCNSETQGSKEPSNNIQKK